MSSTTSPRAPHPPPHPRPPHLRPGLVGLVAAGGAVGSAARYGVSAGFGPADGWPTATFVENLLGAFLLGVLLEALVRRGPESGGRRNLRLALGTGLLGGFTTFSTLAIEVERLAAEGRVGLGLAYGATSVVAGACAALAGVVVGSWRARGRGRGAGPETLPRVPSSGGGSR